MFKSPRKAKARTESVPSDDSSQAIAHRLELVYASPLDSWQVAHLMSNMSPAQIEAVRGAYELFSCGTNQCHPCSSFMVEPEVTRSMYSTICSHCSHWMSLVCHDQCCWSTSSIQMNPLTRVFAMLDRGEWDYNAFVKFLFMLTIERSNLKRLEWSSKGQVTSFPSLVAIRYHVAAGSFDNEVCHGWSCANQAHTTQDCRSVPTWGVPQNWNVQGKLTM